jgi:hypothetical protein
MRSYNHDDVDAVLLADCWHFVEPGSFDVDHDSFSFITRPDEFGNGGGNLVIGDTDRALLAVRLKLTNDL